MRVLKLAIILSFVFLSFNGKAQKIKPDYGKGQDSIDCILNLNFYLEEYNKKDFKAAYPMWREALRVCPKSGENLYIRGANIMRVHIDGIKDPVQKKAAVDSLLMLYDRRIEYYGANKSETNFRKADIIDEYFPQNMEEIYKAYLSAIEVDKVGGRLMAAARAMAEAKKMYEAKKIDADKFADIYTNLSEIVDLRIKASVNDSVKLADAKECKAAIENAFISTEAANCENLIRLFTPRFEANKGDISTVGMIVSILSNRECTQNDLFYQAAEAYNKLDPSPKSSYTLALMFHSKGEMDKAIQYYKEAIDGQTDPTDKSNYQVTLAGIYMQQGQNGQAMTHAKQAISLNPRNGRAYMILAATYSMVKNCGDDPVSRRSVFWVAYDVLQKGRQMESDPKILEDINKNMNLYRQYFPKFDDCFDLDILDGQSYTVSCGGINERTIVRTLK